MVSEPYLLPSISRSRCVPLPRMQTEDNLLGVRLTRQAEQINQAASQPVHRPGGHRVDFALGDRAHQPPPRRPLLARHAAADAIVVEHAGDRPAVLVRDGTRVPDLVLTAGPA